MQIQQREEGTVAIMALAGELDAASLPAISEAVAQAVDQGHRSLVLNFADVAFVTSSAVGYMLKVANHLRDQGGGLAISSPPVWFARNLDTLGVTQSLPTFADDAAALAWLNAE
jgi:anti-anti-sigma factor